MVFRPVSAVALVAIVAFAGLGFGDCSNGDPSASTATSDADPPHNLSNGEFPITSVPAERLAPCRGGGRDLLVEDVACAKALRLVIPLGDPFSRYRSLAERNRQVISRQRSGWTCWSQLAGDFGPIHNVCWRDGQTMVFDEG